MLFEDIIGHEYIKSMLKNAVKYNRVAHAYLFYGPDGIGKNSMAGAFAQTLVCENPKDGAACGVCPACKKVMSDNHPDIHYIKPAGASLKIEQVRSLQKEVQLKPYEGKKKVFVISPANVLTGQAANSLLKTLEDPPEATVFILTAVNPYTLLPTILSRCQQINFNKVSTDLIKKLLIEKYHKSPEEALFMAILADGIVGKVTQLIESGNINEQRDLAIKLAEIARDGNYLDFYRCAEELENHKNDIITIMDFMLSWYRDILVWQESGDPELLINIDKRDTIAKQQRESAGKLLQIIKLIEKIKNQISANVNFRLATEVLLLSINHV